MAKKLLPVLLSASFLAYVAFNIEPPDSFTSATFFQLAYFFLPAFLLTASLFNLHFRFWPKSLIAALGIILLLIFKSLEMLNAVSISLTVAATILIIRSLKKSKNTLPKQSQIQPLSRLKKQ